MKTITTIEELMNELESGNYNFYGLRKATNHDLEIIESGREYLDCSYNWVDNTITDEQLCGTCAIYVSEYMTEKELQKKFELVNHRYIGKTMLLIGDKGGVPGEDEGEYIIGSNGYGAYVLATVEF